MKDKQRRKKAYEVGFISIILNTILFVIKYWAGLVSGSVALIADAWHTLSDSISSIIVIIGTKLSGKKACKKHPFGYGRWEQISAIFVGVLLSIVAYEFLLESIEKFSNKQTANFGTLAIVVTIISIIVKELLARYSIHVGNKIKNDVVKADGWHHRSDALSSIVILIGIMLRNYFWWIDSILGVAVALLLFYAAYEIMKDSIEPLLGEEASKQMIKDVTNICKNHCKIDPETHHFHIHNYGHHKELSFHLKLDENMNLKQSHKIVDKIEKEIRKKLHVEPTIHVDPLKNN